MGYSWTAEGFIEIFVGWCSRRACSVYEGIGRGWVAGRECGDLGTTSPSWKPHVDQKGPSGLGNAWVFECDVESSYLLSILAIWRPLAGLH